VKQTNDEGNIPKSKMSLIHDDGDLRLDPTWVAKEFFKTQHLRAFNAKRQTTWHSFPQAICHLHIAIPFIWRLTYLSLQFQISHQSTMLLPTIDHKIKYFSIA
jgi:hypothetical protein